MGITNPGFNVDTSGWIGTDANASMTLTSDSTITYEGARSAKMVNTLGGEDDYLGQFIDTSDLRPGLQFVTAYYNVTSFTSAAISSRGLALVVAGSLSADTITAATTDWVKTEVVKAWKYGQTFQIRLYAPQGTVYWDNVAINAEPVAWLAG